MSVASLPEGGAMATMFSDEQRQLQDRFDTRRLADRIEEVLVKDSLNDHERAFIEKRDMFFLATCDADGQPTCSYKGGDPGFVRVLDERTLAFPNYDGNGMYLSMGNVLQHAPVGMLFIDFEKQNRMRVDGLATVDLDDPMAGDWPEAQFVVRVATRRVYPNCPRYIHKYSLVERSRFVPRAEASTPVPDWKRSDWACDVLPATDPARETADGEETDR